MDVAKSTNPKGIDQSTLVKGPQIHLRTYSVPMSRSANQDTPLNTFSNTLVYARFIVQHPTGLVLVLTAGHCS
jgi:hypothetical protein